MSNMNYELCKKLKDAGFPQILSSRGIDDYIDKNECYYKFGGKNRAFVPWLSLLIELCENKFLKLVKFSKLNDEEIGMWEEIQGKNSPVPFWGAYSYERCEYGKSPEEAVANLWLELKTK